jgi:uncharacterized protein YjbJ (UPF0337 family)
MDWNQIEGNWEQFKGKIRDTWGQLTENDIDTIKGKKDQLIGKIQERYGVAKDEASRQVDKFMSDS